MGKSNIFSIGVQSGDKVADNVVSAHYVRLRQLLKDGMRGIYSEDIIEFSPVLRVDGKLWHWDRVGFGNVRVSKKSRSATADIFVPAEKWMMTQLELRKYLADCMRDAYNAILDRMKKNRLTCNYEKLEHDLDEVLVSFRHL